MTALFLTNLSQLRRKYESIGWRIALTGERLNPDWVSKGVKETKWGTKKENLIGL